MGIRITNKGYFNHDLEKSEKSHWNEANVANDPESGIKKLLDSPKRDWIVPFFSKKYIFWSISGAALIL